MGQLSSPRLLGTAGFRGRHCTSPLNKSRWALLRSSAEPAGILGPLGCSPQRAGGTEPAASFSSPGVLWRSWCALTGPPACAAASWCEEKRDSTSCLCDRPLPPAGPRPASRCILPLAASTCLFVQVPCLQCLQRPPPTPLSSLASVLSLRLLADPSSALSRVYLLWGVLLFLSFLWLFFSPSLLTGPYLTPPSTQPPADLKKYLGD